MIDLSGRVALVTGASRGIGRACALRLAEAGADVVVNFVTSKSAALEVAGQIQALGSRAAAVKADVSERKDVESMVEFIQKTYGRLDIVVSNAATGGFRPLVATTDRHFEAAMKTNAQPLIYLVQAALPLLERSEGRAKVVVISSHGSQLALPMYGTIGASKAALEALVRHFALELGNRGINFNVVKAGLVATDSTRRLPDAEAMFDGSKYKSLAGQQSLSPSNVADAVLFLSSPLSDMIQAETLTVDAGVAVHA